MSDRLAGLVLLGAGRGLWRHGQRLQGDDRRSAGSGGLSPGARDPARRVQPLHDRPARPRARLGARPGAAQAGAGADRLRGLRLLLEPLGFILATLLDVAVLGWLLGAKLWQSAAAGLGIALVLFLLFNNLLGLPLPAGVLALPG